MLIEVCAGSLNSALIAQECGAQRVELCQNLMVGGTTPSPATIQLCREHLDIDVFVLLRPRSGDFVYSDMEMEILLKDIEFCHNTGVDGIVIGALESNGQIDEKKIKRLVDAAKGLEISFHRAFDYVADPLNTLEQLIRLKIKRVLTSGQQNTAIEGKELIEKMVKKAAGEITILAGGGIHFQNVLPLIQSTGVKEIHLSAKSLIKSKATYPGAVQLNSTAQFPEHDYYQTDPQKLKAIVRLLSR